MVPLVFLPEATRQRRLTVAVRGLLAIPLLVWLAALNVVAVIAVVLIWFVTLATGRPPALLATFLADWIELGLRVDCYLYFLTDKYPSFRLHPPFDPASAQLVVEFEYQRRSSVLFRFVLVLPKAILSSIASQGISAVSVISWLLTLLLGRLPMPLHRATCVVLRYSARVSCYAFVLSTTYPRGLFGDLDAGPAVPAASLGLPSDPSLGRNASIVLDRGGKALVAAVFAVGLITAVGEQVPLIHQHAPVAGPTRNAFGTGWLVPGIDIVGGPILADGHVLVDVVDQDHSLWLEAFDARTGMFSWRLPVSFSDAASGPGLTPVASGRETFVMLPLAQPLAPAVELAAADIATGRIVWYQKTPFTVEDPPTNCPGTAGRGAFCFVYSTTSSVFTLRALAATSGALVGYVPDIVANMSEGPGLYETDASVPSLAAVAFPPGKLWTRTVRDLFGSPLYSPDNSSTFQRFGALLIGSVGSASHGGVSDLADTETVAIKAHDGTVIWRSSGDFQCGGDLTLTGNFLCVTSGRLTYPSNPNGNVAVSRGARGELMGFDPVTGRKTWHFAFGHLQAVLNGDPVRILDDRHLLVTPATGRSEVLDLKSGGTSRPTGREIFWCQHLPGFYGPAKETLSTQLWAVQYTACDDTGRPTTMPGRVTKAVGVSFRGLFIWASPAGLEAVRPGA